MVALSTKNILSILPSLGGSFIRRYEYVLRFQKWKNINQFNMVDIIDGENVLNTKANQTLSACIIPTEKQIFSRPYVKPAQQLEMYFQTKNWWKFDFLCNSLTMAGVEFVKKIIHSVHQIKQLKISA